MVVEAAEEEEVEETPAICSTVSSFGMYLCSALYWHYKKWPIVFYALQQEN